MRVSHLIAFLVFFWPLSQLLWKAFRYFTYVEVKLPCGTFEVRRAFRYNMYVMTRIVAKEFFDGGNVDAENMKAMYKYYGPLSWDAGRNHLHSVWLGLKAWCKRYLTPNKRRLEQMEF